MNNNIIINMKPIGTIEPQENGVDIVLHKGFGNGLLGLEGFSHVLVLWQFDKVEWQEGVVSFASPYKSYQGEMGIFATRGPFRPNGIALCVCKILSIDVEGGRLTVDWTEADPQSPVLDIKPFHPCSDIVGDVQVPSWCGHWPKSREASAEFDWESEFTF